MFEQVLQWMSFAVVVIVGSLVAEHIAKLAFEGASRLSVRATLVAMELGLFVFLVGMLLKTLWGHAPQSHVSFADVAVSALILVGANGASAALLVIATNAIRRQRGRMRTRNV
ncbi:hypothetical protein HYW18_02120 [Candidatus Uhrbacteria bacterium]|nr:hypothetical protein [Candidatus Uhrbacteria bacterium]